MESQAPTETWKASRPAEAQLPHASGLPKKKMHSIQSSLGASEVHAGLGEGRTTHAVLFSWKEAEPATVLRGGSLRGPFHLF